MLPWCSPGSVYLVGMHLEPAVTAEVHPAANDAYHAHAAARFSMYECVLKPNAINLPWLVVAIMSLFLVAQSP